MMGNARKNDTGKAGHGVSLSQARKAVNLGVITPVTVIPEVREYNKSTGNTIPLKPCRLASYSFIPSSF
jgi:hypothetical protein